MSSSPHKLACFENDDRPVVEICELDLYEVDRLAKLLPSQTHPILDCGAHVGAFACHLARHGVPNPITCFEPVPGNFELLQANAAHWPQISCQRRAIGARFGVVRLHQHADRSAVWSSSPWWPIEQTSSIVVVGQIAFAGYVRRHGPFAAIKLDLEGEEAAIIQALNPWLARQCGLLVLESHDHQPSDLQRVAWLGWRQVYAHGSRHRVFVHRSPAAGA